MKTILVVFSFLGIVLIQSCTSSSKKRKLYVKPPVAEKINHKITTPHGNERVDPYFWMRLSDEQKNAPTPDEQTQKVRNYLNAENAYTREVMKHTEKFQEDLFNEMKGRIKQDDESVPFFKNGYWYMTRYEKGNEYPIYSRKKGKLENEEEILLDVNKMAEDKDYYSISALKVSRDNNVLAFAEDTLSRRVYTIRFKNLETGEMLSDVLTNVQGDGAWSEDGDYFFYTSKNKVTLLSEKIWRHKMGTDMSQDVLVYEEKNPSYYIGINKSKSDKYLIIVNSSTLVSDYHLLEADNPTGTFRQFIPRGEKHEYAIYHFQDKFYIVTNHEAENFRLMETPENATAMENWVEVIPHREDVLLEGIEVFSNHLTIEERKDAQTNIRIINQSSGDEHYLTFDEAAYVAYTGNNPEFDTDILRFGYQSMTTPASVIDYDMNTREKALKKQVEVVGGHDPEDYATERIWAPARDGVKIPVSIVYKKGFKKEGKSPLLLYGYGSYGNIIDPSFSSVRLSLLDRGFAFAIAHVRGGQIMGRKWYDEGKMYKKQNTFNDFVDCAKFLIAQKYTSADHLYAQGGSAGGLLMGAVVNMNPELFNGVIAAVPFVDVVSTMLDESIPLTTNEFDEWGNPKNEDSYTYMLSYSPYDQVKAQDYPNMLITTGLFDSQVQYWEPAKWVAKLRDMKTDDNILILDCDMDSGHGGASGRFSRLKRTALEYAFVLDLEEKY